MFSFSLLFMAEFLRRVARLQQERPLLAVNDVSCKLYYNNRLFLGHNDYVSTSSGSDCRFWFESFTLLPVASARVWRFDDFSS